ncbi:MAG: hypothetical protein K2R98_04950 [Gemmataceae bacterium]|nr:hypothetical protein [Gemmataceae bacterium]
MDSFRGNLMRRGQTIIEGVEGRLTVDVGPQGAERWSGYFTLPAGNTVELEEPFELVLSDGRSGKIRVDRVNQTGQGSSASFTHAG